MTIRALEFYSGIGGLHLALVRSAWDAQVVAAYDWDPAACQVYAANYGPGAVKATDICRLTAADVAIHRAHLWLLSPSCQPYTVLNPKAKGEDDPRAASFLHLIRNVLPRLHSDHPDHAPRWLLIENNSTTRRTLVQILRALEYNLEEFLLTPHQFGIPNSRLRYYLLASLEPGDGYGRLTQDSTLLDGSGQIRRSIPCTEKQVASPPLDSEPSSSIRDVPLPISLYLDDFIESTANPQSFAIPQHVLAKWGRLLDIVKPSDRRSCCFTRSYTKLVEGSGSVLQMDEALDTTITFKLYAEAVQEGSHPNPLSILDPLRLRYFTPNELLKIFHFNQPQAYVDVYLPPANSYEAEPQPYSFKWPPSITTKTQYRLIGNSFAGP
ncbi:hypothetical protein M407DRAFT_25715 [Tulasnella calospora MUT 4182]|uniref:S-adenosyl-L-methionine-dependent methyltransferase n=1 Tax=Tulasnella calospora MUT 4182 TaxID=1051891 RepID=A0A0C3KU05_9AGAM|nr:hypothetical protein M407DRAFT_25715 [Tulasnella calospora MUT 4182]